MLCRRYMIWLFFSRAKTNWLKKCRSIQNWCRIIWRKCNKINMDIRFFEAIYWKNKFWISLEYMCVTIGLLICALISENQGPEKLRSVTNLRKISVPAHLIFFSVCHLYFFHFYGRNLKKIQLTNWKENQVYWKKIQVCRTWNFSKVWNRP